MYRRQTGSKGLLPPLTFPASLSSLRRRGQRDPDDFENSEDERRFLNASEDEEEEEGIEGEDMEVLEEPGEWMEEDDEDEEYEPLDEDEDVTWPQLVTTKHTSPPRHLLSPRSNSPQLEYTQPLFTHR